VPKKKLIRFTESKTFANLFQPDYSETISGFHLKGNWRTDFFRNNNPVVLELGCGKGEYTVGLAEKYPDKNFIGIDIKGARIWRGCKTSNEKKLSNVCFLRSRIDLIEHFFEPDEVDEIWITFPDPQLKERKTRKRLISQHFINKYKRVIKPDGIVHLKTDNIQFFEYALEVIDENNHKLLLQTFDLYNSGIIDDVVKNQKFY